MKQEHSAEKRSPEQPRQPPDCIQEDSNHDLWNIVILRNPDMKLVFREVRDVASQCSGVMVHRLAHENPTHVRPPLAIDGRVRIAFLIEKLMMDAVRRDPENR